MKPRAGSRLAALAVLLAACASGPEVQPFRGPPPRTIAILPLTGAELSEPLRRALDESVRLHVAERGYAVIGPDVVGGTLPAEVEPGPELWVALRRDFGADAVLERSGRVEPGRSDRGGRPFSVQWTLWSTDDGSVLWSRREQGVPGAVLSRHLTGPAGRYEPDPFFSDEPIAGRGEQRWTRDVLAREPAQQAEAIQRALAARLPRARREG